MHADGSARRHLRAVATDGHRLAQVDMRLPKGADGCPAVIGRARRSAKFSRLDRGQRRRGLNRIVEGKIASPSATWATRSDDGTPSPDYGRVIPQARQGADRRQRDFAAAVDRVSDD